MPIKARQSWDEFCAEQDRELERERRAMASWSVQMSEQKPGVFRAKRGAIIAILAGLGTAVAIIWVLKQIIDALVQP